MNEVVAAASFHYDAEFCCNLGWTTEWEQASLRHKRVAIAGMGGVGGSHLLTLARLGIGRFTIADFDRFDVVNQRKNAICASCSAWPPKDCTGPIWRTTHASI